MYFHESATYHDLPCAPYIIISILLKNEKLLKVKMTVGSVSSAVRASLFLEYLPHTSMTLVVPLAESGYVQSHYPVNFPSKGTLIHRPSLVIYMGGITSRPFCVNISVITSSFISSVFTKTKRVYMNRHNHFPYAN